MYKLKQSQTARPLLFLMVDSADHVSAKTGLTPTVTLSKNGASFASPAGAVSEVGSGWYKVAPNATDTATLGPLLLHATASSADPVDVVFEVIAYDPEDGASLGLSRLDAAVSTRLASASYTTPPTVVQVRQEMDSNSTKLANLDAAVSSRAAPGAAMTLSAAYDAAKTAASQTSVDTLTGYVDTEVAAIKAKTDNLPASPAATGDIPSAATVAGQVRTDLTTELGRIDAAISSRLASASYTAPDNAGIAAVKAKTDGLNFTGTDVKATLDGETVTPAAGSITAAVIATNAIDADALAADAVSELQAGLSTLDGAGVQSALTAQGYTTTRAGYLDTLNGLVAAIWAAATRTLTAFGFGVTVTTNADKSGYSLATAPPTAAEVADAVWDEAQSGHASAGTFGKYLDAQVSTVGGGSLTAAAIADAVWDEATSDHQTAGTTGKALTSASAAGDPLLNTVPGSYASGTAGYALGRIGSGPITVTAFVGQTGNAQIVAGDDYSATDARALDWTEGAGSLWPTDLTGATVAVKVYAAGTLLATWAGSVVTATGSSKKVRCAPSATQTGALAPGSYQIDVEATLASGRKATLVPNRTLTVL